jgi:hypothetical protein
VLSPSAAAAVMSRTIHQQRLMRLHLKHRDYDRPP